MGIIDQVIYERLLLSWLKWILCDAGFNEFHKKSGFFEWIQASLIAIGPMQWKYA